MSLRIAFFSTQPQDRTLYPLNSPDNFQYTFHNSSLSPSNIALCANHAVISLFVHDHLTRPMLQKLQTYGISLIAMRCAGTNNVDLVAAEEFGIKVKRVPSYSPQAIAEHTIALLLTLSRRIHKAYSRVKEGNFGLGGLLGMNVHGKTIGVVGTGQIGQAFCRIVKGFGCRVVAFDVYKDKKLMEEGVEYVESVEELYKISDVISLHCPLTETTKYMIGEKAIELMKNGVMLINTSRGALVDTKALIRGLKSKKIGAVGLDVYEGEEGVFFKDCSEEGVEDDVLGRLVGFGNVVVTPHMAFYTKEAVDEIVRVTVENISSVSVAKERK